MMAISRTKKYLAWIKSCIRPVSELWNVWCCGGNTCPCMLASTQSYKNIYRQTQLLSNHPTFFNPSTTECGMKSLFILFLLHELPVSYIRNCWKVKTMWKDRIRFSVIKVYLLNLWNSIADHSKRCDVLLN